jgi:hypothetical protein
VLAETCRAIGELLLLTGPFPLVDSRFNGKHAGRVLTVFAVERACPTEKDWRKNRAGGSSDVDTAVGPCVLMQVEQAREGKVPWEAVSRGYPTQGDVVA